MSLSRRLWHVFASLAVCGGLAVAQSNEPVETAQPVAQPVSWLDAIWNLPVFRWFSAPEVTWLPRFEEAAPAQLAELPPPPPCSVEPLPAVTDSNAAQFEAMVGVGPVVDLDGLTPRTSQALTRFESLVAKSGGEITLTSAFRPEAYQQHLRDVWFKWMEVRDNFDPACMTLKAQVGDEFTRHQLLITQHPVPVSDHTLGIGVDAAVQWPTLAPRARRRRVSLDRIARLAGMMRPDIRRDPVHFRLIGGRG